MSVYAEEPAERHAPSEGSGPRPIRRGPETAEASAFALPDPSWRFREYAPPPSPPFVPARLRVLPATSTRPTREASREAREEPPRRAQGPRQDEAATRTSHFLAGQGGVMVEHPANRYGQIAVLFTTMPPRHVSLARVTEELGQLGGRFVPFKGGAPGDGVYRVGAGGGARVVAGGGARGARKPAARTSPRRAPVVRDKLVGTVVGTDVWLVHGRAVRDTIDVDFTMGGNPFRYDYVPPGEVWIDATLGPKDVAATVVHEVAEMRGMSGGKRYAAAHAAANVPELEARALLQGVSIRDRREAVVWARSFLDERGLLGRSGGRPRGAAQAASKCRAGSASRR